MPPILRYQDLELVHVDRLLSEHRVLRLELDPRRAAPLAALIDIARGATAGRGLPLIPRLRQLCRGLWLTLRILVRHSKLFSLLNVIVLDAPSQTWHARSDGTVVFQFIRSRAKV